MEASEKPPLAIRAQRLLDRWGFVAGGIMLFVLIWLAYHTSLKHVPRADQWILLLDTVDHHEFFDLVAHSYSYSRTRVIYAGDTQLFRPFFFVLLSAERALFGNDFRLWHAAGVTLHFLAVLLFLRALLRLQALLVPAGAAPCPSWLASGLPLRLVPYALALFFALNFAVVEQVIWFNINGYILFVVLVLASFLLFLEATANPGLTARQQRLCLIGAWLLILLGAFTYEMGQLYAVLAGLFVTVARARRGRALRAGLVGLAFVSIALLYQGANHLDRQHHEGQYVDDVVPTDITDNLFTPMTADHWKRYSVFALAQPFLPLHCRTEMMPFGKGMLSEQVWNGDMSYDAAFVLSLAAPGLLILLVLAGLGQLLVTRQWKWLLPALLALGTAGAHMSLIVFGRMNLRPAPDYLHLNHYYIYISLLFVLLTCGAALALLRTLRSSLLAGIANGMAALLVIGLVALSVASGFQTHRVNADTARIFKPYRWMNDSLRDFVRAHEHEEDFCFALQLEVGDGLPSVTGVPCPVILYKRYLDNAHPKYVVRFERLRAVAMPAEEWRRQYQDHEDTLCPELMEIGSPFHIFRYRDRYYALEYNAAIVFVYARDREAVPGALRDDSLEGIRRQIEAIKAPSRAAAK